MSLDRYVSINDDYCSLTAGRYGFYIGYESTVCPVHGDDSKECRDSDCDDYEWAFVVEDRKAEIGRVPLSRLGKRGEPLEELLLRGIAAFGNKYWKPF